MSTLDLIIARRILYTLELYLIPIYDTKLFIIQNYSRHELYFDIEAFIIRNRISEMSVPIFNRSQLKVCSYYISILKQTEYSPELEISSV